MRLTLKRIFKDYDSIPESEYIGKFAFYLHDVLRWEEYVEGDFENQEPKIIVHFKEAGFILLISFDSFEKIMNNFRQQALYGRPIFVSEN